MALTTNGSVIAWGSGTDGLTTVPLAARSGVVAISAGDFHMLALKTNGLVVAWGNNNQGQTTVPLAARSGVVAISAGGCSIALKSDGSIVAWGTRPDYVPTGLPPALAVTAGGLALLRDPQPALTLLRQADQKLSLSWRGAGTLEQTDSLTTPDWQTAPDQANPQTMSTAGPMKFFRVKTN